MKFYKGLFTYYVLFRIETGISISSMCIGISIGIDIGINIGIRVLILLLMGRR